MTELKKKKAFWDFNEPGCAVITGASSGLGLCFANKLAELGFNLVLVARRSERLHEIATRLQSEFSIKCEIIRADLALAKDINKVSESIKQISNLDFLINNAGFATQGYFADVPIEKDMNMLHVHMAAPIQFSHTALQIMIKRKHGAIINVSSLGAYILTPGNVLYDATKSFLITFSENLKAEVKGLGIKIQALCPGFVSTEFHEVGDLKNFDKSAVPDSSWMTPESVVLQSLKALEKNKRTVFIPGRKKRFTKWLYTNSSLVRYLFQRKIEEIEKSKKLREANKV
ncbi:SDR family NAD(P)-dependent oxidoreductase [Draconibacterium sediminis]|uniref:SDR family NAD(P)-dependent oxidoreductase n=1 Tax=Draconibacterium sediminis TaxID=1544798 RepID=UPI0005D3A514|nr:SDR family oxidoreductase [Draconibacterium sediminis]